MTLSDVLLRYLQVEGLMSGHFHSIGEVAARVDGNLFFHKVPGIRTR